MRVIQMFAGAVLIAGSLMLLLRRETVLERLSQAADERDAAGYRVNFFRFYVWIRSSRLRSALWCAFGVALGAWLLFGSL